MTNFYLKFIIETNSSINIIKYAGKYLRKKNYFVFLEITELSNEILVDNYYQNSVVRIRRNSKFPVLETVIENFE